jgi:hypothetical protein
MVTVLLSMAVAHSADLTGWDGIPWGSTKGGPKDPAMANDMVLSVARTSTGEIGLLQVTLTMPATRGTIAGVEVALPAITYIDGEAAQYRVVISPSSGPGTPADMAAAMANAAGAFSAAFGPPKESVPTVGYWYFETADATLMLNQLTVTVRSKAGLKKCATMFGQSCGMLLPQEAHALRAQ